MRCRLTFSLMTMCCFAVVACQKQPGTGSGGPAPDSGGTAVDGGDNVGADAGPGPDAGDGGGSGVDGGAGAQADGGGDDGGSTECVADGGGGPIAVREWAAWPIVEQPVLDAGVDTVRDTTTGLVWQRGMSDGGIPIDGGTRRYSLQDAIDYCAQLAGASFAGYGDWRLPTTTELISILDMTNYFPAVDSAAFPGNNNNSGFWTSSVDSDDAGQAWTVNLADGQVYLISTNPAGNDPNSQNRVRCVR